MNQHLAPMQDHESKSRRHFRGRGCNFLGWGYDLDKDAPRTWAAQFARGDDVHRGSRDTFTFTPGRGGRGGGGSKIQRQRGLRAFAWTCLSIS